MKRISRTPLVLLFWLVISLACNFPERAGRSGGISAQELRQTLAAISTATTPGAPLITPGGTQVPPATLFAGLSTATPVDVTPSGSVTRPPDYDPAVFRYHARSGDTLLALAGRFEVEPGQITSDQPIPKEAFIPPGQLLVIPNLLEAPPPFPSALLPDSELINSPSTAGFDVRAFVDRAGGFLSTYQETLQGERLSGADIVGRVARESSVNPRFLLALLEYRSGWVYGGPRSGKAEKYPIGFNVAGWEGLYKELVITATHLNMAYYGWRAGTITEMKYTDGSRMHMDPELNVGSATVQHLLAKLYKPEPWKEALYGPDSFVLFYELMFGDPWTRAATIEPLFPPGLAQPELELPFQPGERWSLTGGPHESWKTGSPRGALDLAPVTGEPECAVSRAWVTASVPGLVIRSERNAVVIDLDGDGYEQTGWTVLYFHVADKERVQSGTWVEVDDRIGHPSCEGGKVTGTHVHIARKYNGEWIAADGPLPFVLSGWEAYAYEKNYQGELRKGDQAAVASPVGPRTSIVTR